MSDRGRLIPDRRTSLRRRGNQNGSGATSLLFDLLFHCLLFSCLFFLLLFSPLVFLLLFSHIFFFLLLFRDLTFILLISSGILSVLFFPRFLLFPFLFSLLLVCRLLFPHFFALQKTHLIFLPDTPSREVQNLAVLFFFLAFLTFSRQIRTRGATGALGGSFFFSLSFPFHLHLLTARLRGCSVAAPLHLWILKGFCLFLPLHLSAFREGRRGRGGTRKRGPLQKGALSV
mmetsp:Transcript_41919/g.82812  ORF Transcript_41919/g.82812 Transcript_41919/m.82812 type:complete len:230 (-) Transcript_41919:939-1628(-)